MDVEAGKPVSPPDAASKPRRDCLLAYSRFMNTSTAICCLLCVVAHGLAIWLAAPRREVSRAEVQLLVMALVSALPGPKP